MWAMSVWCRLGMHDWFPWRATHIDIKGRTCQRCGRQEETEIKWLQP